MGMHHIEEADMPAAITHPGVIIGDDGMPYVDSDGRLFNRADGLGMPRATQASSIQGKKNEHK